MPFKKWIFNSAVLLLLLIGFHFGIDFLPLSAGLKTKIGTLVLVAAIFVATATLAKMAVGLIDLYVKKSNRVLPATSIFTNLTRVFVFVIGGLIVLQSLGISITPILTALGVGGLAVALALQETLANLFAGLHIILSRQVRPGDYVELDSGKAGYVSDINWRNTVIRTLPNNTIIVPNAKLASAIITNYNRPDREVAVTVEVGVSYESDLKNVEKVTVQVAKEILKEIEGGVPEFEPVIRYHTFADSGINFDAVLRAKEFANQSLLKHEFIKRLHERYQKEEIEFPFPTRTVYLKKEA
ncbi:MAG: mechanosensitive ion channel family protein [Deltaproteobacteria bacterium]|nr:mechanosensitive ion channel family protein [Deltaproteobacteria bacterium]